MRWIGLTGSIGAGKSTVANLLRKSGFTVIDADALAHQGLKSGTPTFNEIVNKFGNSILGQDGEINRRALGRIIFGDPTLRTWLENLLHPMVQDHVRKLRHQLETAGESIAFYEVPLLFEKNLQSQFDKVVVVWVSSTVQDSRLATRNGWTNEEIEQRNRSQIPVADKIRKADYAINNDGSLEQLEIQVKDLIKKLSN